MSLFTWNTYFQTDLTSVDEQHQKLVNLVNEFTTSFNDPEDSEKKLQQAFQALTTYTTEHFEDEEKLMSDTGLDERHQKEHKEQHDLFKESILTLYQDALPFDSKTPPPLFEYLVFWLSYHILGSDQKMSSQIHAINNGMDATIAYEQTEGANDETSALLHVVDKLLGLISTRNSSLNELNTQLESKVQKRTKELLVANKQLNVLATTDELTRLPNRRAAMKELEERITESLVQQKPFSCLMMDLDNFKGINDSFGHDVGDTTLKSIAQEIRHAIRHEDRVFRLSGDEFLVTCANTRGDGALLVGQNICRAIAGAHIQTGEGTITTSISVGVATTSATINSSTILLKTADRGLYKAKEGGRNCVRSVEQL